MSSPPGAPPDTHPLSVPNAQPFHVLAHVGQLAADVLRHLGSDAEASSATLEQRLHAADVGLRAVHVGLLDMEAARARTQDANDADEDGITGHLAHRHVSDAFGPSSSEMYNLAAATAQALESERARLGELVHVMVTILLDADDLDDARAALHTYLSAHPRAVDISALLDLLASSLPPVGEAVAPAVVVPSGDASPRADPPAQP